MRHGKAQGVPGSSRSAKEAQGGSGRLRESQGVPGVLRRLREAKEGSGRLREPHNS